MVIVKDGLAGDIVSMNCKRSIGITGFDRLPIIRNYRMGMEREMTLFPVLKKPLQSKVNGAKGQRLPGYFIFPKQFNFQAFISGMKL